MIVSDLLKEQSGIRHGFFTRMGGVSDGIYASLNCGYGSGDETAKVRQNRAIVAAKLGTSAENLITPRQVHSPRVVVAETPWRPDGAPDADAMVTRAPGLAVGVLTADCAPILFADDEARIVAAAHAGWRGARHGVIEAVLDAMEAQGAIRERIHAAIGPAISQAAYEVGPEFEADFLAADEGNGTYFASSAADHRARFDLPGYCRDRALKAGIGYVEASSHCTYGSESLFFSYRRSTHGGVSDYGRQISAIVIL